MWHENGEVTQKVVAATNKDLKELQYQSVDEVVEAQSGRCMNREQTVSRFLWRISSVNAIELTRICRAL